MPSEVKTILVIDECLDDAFRIHCHCNDIPGFRHRFQHIASASEALSTIVDKSADIVFIALDLNGTTGGRELLVELRNLGYDRPLIMVLKNGDEHLMPALMRDGADDCLMKDQSSADTIRATLAVAEQEALRRQAEVQQRALLTKTVTASVMILIDMLSTMKPKAFNRAKRARDVIRQLVSMVNEGRSWEIEVAAMLSPIGCIHLPESLLDTLDRHRPLSPSELELFHHHPQTGASIIRAIPRMAHVAEIVAYQEKHYDGSGYPRDDRKHDQIPLGARILKLALDFQALRHAGYSLEFAIEELQQRKGWYDPQLLTLLYRHFMSPPQIQARQVAVCDLDSTMVLDEPVTTRHGKVLVRQGMTVTETQRRRLLKLSADNQLNEPVRVRVVNAALSETRFESAESVRRLTGFLQKAES